MAKVYAIYISSLQSNKECQQQYIIIKYLYNFTIVTTCGPLFPQYQNQHDDDRIIQRFFEMVVDKEPLRPFRTIGMWIPSRDTLLVRTPLPHQTQPQQQPQPQYLHRIK